LKSTASFGKHIFLIKLAAVEIRQSCKIMPVMLELMIFEALCKHQLD